MSNGTLSIFSSRSQNCVFCLVNVATQNSRIDGSFILTWGVENVMSGRYDKFCYKSQRSQIFFSLTLMTWSVYWSFLVDNQCLDLDVFPEYPEAACLQCTWNCYSWTQARIMCSVIWHWDWEKIRAEWI